MSSNHKDLPPSSQKWAGEVDAMMKELAALREVVRRLTENAGIDMANPQRGINTGNTPSIKSPVAQKLSSLADVQSYNVADKQVLTWSQQDQKWLPAAQAVGINWQIATEEEHLFGDLDNDSDYYGTSVIGLRNPYPPGVDYNTGGTGDSYGLVGSSTTSAFLHGAMRWMGGPTRAHGYVSAEPFYCKMGVTWIDDETGGWEDWGEIGVSRGDVYLETPMGEPSEIYPGDFNKDGLVSISSNWFYVPKVNGVLNVQWNIKYPKRPVPLAGQTRGAGAMVYDMTLKKPIWWQGTKWVDAMGNDIPAATY